MSQDLRLLMVEDSEDDAELLLRELRRGGYTVTAERVDTPAAMRAALERQSWDIVLSDHAMPKFSAPAALALLKEARPELPFIIVSNEIDLHLAVSLMKAGAQDYIQKRELAQVGPAIQRELREVDARRQRQAVEAALRDSEKRYRDLVEFLPQVVYETDLQGNFTIVNRLGYDLFGYSDADLLEGLNLMEVIQPEEHARARAGMRRLLQGEKLPPARYLARRKDGHVFPVEITSALLWQDQRPAGLRGVLKDMSDFPEIAYPRQAAELEQRQQELATVSQLIGAIAMNLNLTEILDQALCGALAITRLEGGAVCLVQPGRQSLALCAAQNAPPGLLADLSAGDVRIGDCFCGQVAQTGTPLMVSDNASASREALRAEGQRFHAAFPLSVKNQPIGVLCLFAHSQAQPTQRSLDLVQQLCGPIALAIDNARLFEQSQSHAAELEQHVVERTVQLAAINQELEAFSYSVAHDLRVPLRSIDGYSQILLEDTAGKLAPEDRHYLERIRAATERMHQLIDDLLELSRLTRGDLERIPLDLSALAQTIAAELRQRTPARQVEFVIAPDILARADAPLMGAALENLLGNAWKFTEKVPAARIEFGEQRQQRDGQEERVYFVRDNGAGFDMAQADKLFQTFQRLHSQDEFPGTGIGLATVKRIIHRHGGRVWAEGAEGQGATFYFTL